MTLLMVGTRTKWGRVSAVGTVEGERYYWITDKHLSVAMMPAVMVEDEA